ncbi:hypothetical protein LI142_13805 [Eubacterium limosum]|uniref:hypothetical protein n=1 Tax=Eubacterium limosum TaxID=1736 RepID=UPI001D07F778|nr:hypothetical protein [Eubacterium limosum]MCB6570574.1 hypothetical protein [Eubacterium limosum]
MNKSRVLKIVVYYLSGVITAFSFIVFWNLFSHKYLIFEDIGEITGTALAVLMGFEMLLFVAVFAIKHKLVPQPVKKYFTLATKYIRQFHYSVGALGSSFFMLHIGVTLDLSNPWTSELVTGYITTVSVFLSILVGLFYKPSSKTVRVTHIAFAIIALLPFILHIA